MFMKRATLLITLVLCFTLGGVLWWAFSPLLFDVSVDDTLDPSIEAALETDGVPSTDMPDDVMVFGPFPIVDTPTHPATGSVRVIATPEGTTIRYENYQGTNGPDLYVYLANDLDGNDFVSLGRTRGNQGNINYTVPEDVNVADYRYVLTWCQAFGVLFDYAEIAS
jgi:hypothetical protein